VSPIFPILLLACMPSAAWAQGSSTPPAGLSPWLAVAVWCLGALLLILNIWHHLFPRRVPAIESEFATKQELCACRAAQQHTIDALARSIETLRDVSEERTIATHRRVDRMVIVLYRIAGKLDVPTGD